MADISGLIVDRNWLQYYINWIAYSFYFVKQLYTFKHTHHTWVAHSLSFYIHLVKKKHVMYKIRMLKHEEWLVQTFLSSMSTCIAIFMFVWLLLVSLVIFRVVCFWSTTSPIINHLMVHIFIRNVEISLIIWAFLMFMVSI